MDATTKTDATTAAWTAASYAAIARFFGADVATVKRWAAAGMPRSRPYRLEAIVQWLRREGPWRARGQGSESLEAWRDKRAKLADLDLHEREHHLVDRDEAHLALGRIAAILRGAGESLGRKFGNDALAVLDEALDDAKREMDLFAPSRNHARRTAKPKSARK